MASVQLPPRQKMINMMYLVLTAILALNVSKEVLDSFVVLNDDLGRSKEANMMRTASELSAFETSAANVPQKFREPLVKARALSTAADSLIEHIEQLKAMVIAEAEGLKPEQVRAPRADGKDTLMSLSRVEMKDDREALAQLLVGSEPGQPKKGPNTANDLKERVIAFRERLKTATPAKEKQLVASLDVLFELGDRPDASGTMNNWESTNFYEVPLVAGVAALSKLQADIRSAENDVVRSIHRSVNADSYAFTELVSAVIPQSNYVTMGDSFRADVFLAAYDSKNAPTVELALEGARVDTATMEIIGNKTVVPLGADGLGKLRLVGSTTGEQSRSGVIRFKGPDGEVRRPFHVNFQVARPELVVSPTKMNVLYRHVDNPIEISVPGFAADRVTPHIDNGTLSRTSTGWVATPGSASQAIVSVTVELPDGSRRNMPGSVFRVKNLPPPTPKLGDKGPSDSRMKKSDITKEQGLKAVVEGSEFQDKWTVTKFDVVLVRAGGNVVTKPNIGNAFTTEVKKLLEAAKPGEQLILENVRAKLNVAGAPEVKLSNLTYKLLPN
ncbi:MAG: gliding motility protein GldM [Flavobacteriales bacterium]